MIAPKSIAHALGFNTNTIKGKFLTWIIYKLACLGAINKIIKKSYSKEKFDFVGGVLHSFSIRFKFNEIDLSKIPKEGPFIVIANHPLGLIDGLLLLHLIGKKRKDFKIFGNFILHQIKPLRSLIFPVNPFKNKNQFQKGSTGISNAISHLRSGGCLGIFPAGEVATKTEHQNRFHVDHEWNHKMIGLLDGENVPFLPVYFHSKNSRWFYFLAKINPLLQTLRIPAEAVSQRKRNIQIRIGNLIRPKELEAYHDKISICNYLRAKTFILSKSLNPKKNDLISRLPKISKPKPIIDPVEPKLLEEDIERIKQMNCKFLEHNGFEVFFSTAELIPNLLKEIGRLREVSFREVGEGTDQEMDLDRYDAFYHHLILWDKTSKKITGAYRMGLGKEIIASAGLNGFYIASLFEIDSSISPLMEKTIEMGRAFIIKEFQNHPLSLHLLWKGIVHVTLRYPFYKYLVGGVSISNEYSNMSKSLIIDYMSSNFYDPKMARFFKPKTAFKIDISDEEVNLIYKGCREYQQNFISMDKLINDIEPKNLKVPILIKKYLKQNAKVIGFNRDRSFNNEIDALLFIAIKDLPESTVKPVLDEFSLMSLSRSNLD